MIIKKGFIAEGTTCESCEEIIKRQARKIDGVKNVIFDYATETGTLYFDDEKTDVDEILDSIETKGYECFILDDSSELIKSKYSKTIASIIALVGFGIVLYFMFGISESFSFPHISQTMGYSLLFLVGLLTGFHCIAMCGGFVLGYTGKDAKEKKSAGFSHIKYGLGKTISYTVIGAGFGLLGGVIAFTPRFRGVVGILAGIFLVLFGLRMLNIFPVLRKFRMKTPTFATKLLGKNSSPFIIGLLNGLMIACGPLQAIYIMAAGTGSMIEGAKVLLIFGLGTLPVMLGFGYVASYVSSKLTTKILKASGAIVVVLGLIMLNNGFVLTGSGYDIGSITGFVSADKTDNTDITLNNGFQEIRMDVTRSGWSPDTFVLKKDVPVKWIIQGKEINGCNNAIQVPAFDLEFNIEQGEQVIEFTPDEEGVIRWSCWMGMIPGTFIVKDDIDLDDKQEIQKQIDSVPKQAAGSCDGSCGVSSCGGANGGSCGCGA